MEKDFWIQIKPIKISTLRGRGLLITYWQTSSSLVRLNSFLKDHNTHILNYKRAIINTS